MVRKPKRNVQEFRGRRTEVNRLSLLFYHARYWCGSRNKPSIPEFVGPVSIHAWTLDQQKEDATQNQHDGQHQNTLQ